MKATCRQCDGDKFVADTERNRITPEQFESIRDIAEAHWERGWIVTDDVSPLQVLGLLDECERLIAERDKLMADVGRLMHQIAGLSESNAMACENPCGDCGGCNYAAERHAEEAHDE